LGANDRLRVAVAGIHRRGQQHITAYGNTRVAELAGSKNVKRNRA